MSALLFKRSNTAGNDAYIGDLGEITIDTQKRKIRIHDGVLAGGYEVANMQDIQSILDGIGIEDVEGLQDALDALNGRIDNLDKDDVGLSNVDNTSDLDKPISTATQTALNGKINTSEKGAANGVATLDSAGKVPTSQLSDSVLGQVEYQGTWNASTNTPTLSTTPTRKGDYYVVSAAGSFASLDFNQGDWIISNGSVWEKVDNTDAVTSVNGKIGAVVIDKTDVGLGNVDNTSDANKPVSTATQTALDGKVDKVAGKGLSTEDYTSTEKTKLAGIEAGAQVNTVTSVAGRTGAVVLAKTDVGLSNVPNYSTATEAESIAGSTTTKFATPQGVRDFVEDGDYIIDLGTF